MKGASLSITSQLYAVASKKSSKVLLAILIVIMITLQSHVFQSAVNSQPTKTQLRKRNSKFEISNSDHQLMLKDKLYRLDPKPSHELLVDFYEHYYTTTRPVTYLDKYSDREIKWMKIFFELTQVSFQKFLSPKNNKKFLDVGAGEGWQLLFAKEHGWNIQGLDYSQVGMQRHNPDLLSSTIFGDIMVTLKSLNDKGECFSVINLINVLEHLEEPAPFLKLARTVLCDGGVMVLRAPNDNTPYQKLLQEKNMADSNYFMALEHLNYINSLNGKEYFEANNWSVKDTFTSFPVQWFLANENSNYLKNPSVGKGADNARQFIETHIYNKYGVDALLELGRAYANVGMGRDVYFILQ
jgi:2-polyprenyl-3-methyl-5-hydroxy-6-metoxy-1,4-benzoquinol methylase